MIDLCDVLSTFLYDLTFEKIPEKTLNNFSLYFADYIAAMCAGYKVNARYNDIIKKYYVDLGGKPESRIPFTGEYLPACDVAYIAATYAHGADMDDGNRKAMGHVAAHVFSAVFAVAEAIKATPKDVITSVIVGYEVYNRLAAAVQPGLVHRGFHSTGTAGVIACAAATAKLLGLNKHQIYNAMSYASIQASGLIIIAESGQSCKPVNPANAAKIGIFSAKMAEKGIDAPILPFNSEKGWIHAMTDVSDISQITETLGKVFTIDESYLKPYPSCRHTHCGIEAGIAIKNEARTLISEDIEYVKVNIYPNAIKIAGQILVPETDDDSKFSIHYSLAKALLTGGFYLSDLFVEKCDTETRNLIQKIELVSDEGMENREKGIRGATVTVKLKNGKVYSKTVLIPKGDAANPFTKQDIVDKLTLCSCGILSDKAQDRILDAAHNFLKNKSVPTLYELTSMEDKK